MTLLYLTQKEILPSCCYKIWAIFPNPVKHKLCADHPWCICRGVTRCIFSTESSVYLLVYSMYKFTLKTVSYLWRKWKSNSEFQKIEWKFRSVEQNRSWYGPPGNVTDVTAHFLIAVSCAEKRGLEPTTQANYLRHLWFVRWSSCQRTFYFIESNFPWIISSQGLSHTKHPSTVLKQSTGGLTAWETVMQDRDWAGKTENI